MNEHCLREPSSAESYHERSPCLPMDVIPLNDVSSHLMLDFGCISREAINIGGTCENVNPSTTVYVGAAAGTSSDDTCSSNANGKNLTDSMSQSTEIMELSCEHEVEPFNASDFARTEEDITSMSQVSTSEVGLLLKDTSPGPHDETTNLEKMESVPMIFKVKRIVDRLRRQVEHDQSCM